MHKLIEESGRKDRFEALMGMGVKESTILQGLEIIKSIGYEDLKGWSFFTNLQEDPLPLEMQYISEDDASTLSIEVVIYNN